MKPFIKVLGSLLLCSLPIIGFAQIDIGGALLRGAVQGVSNSISNSSSSSPIASKKTAIDEGFPEPTRIELRMMQSRKFDKPSSQVLKSIIELHKDKNVYCGGRDIIFNFVGLRYGDMQMKTKNGIKQSVYKGYFKSYEAISPGFINCANGYQFELTADALVKADGSEFVYDDYNELVTQSSLGNFPDKPKTTIVRLRIINPDRKQSYNPERYQGAFKEIADGLFVDAIQLNPTEMK
jgi:hypothetical protein